VGEKYQLGFTAKVADAASSLREGAEGLDKNHPATLAIKYPAHHK
jgi:hypothetical protein